jgi:hypothetical protein
LHSAGLKFSNQPSERPSPKGRLAGDHRASQATEQEENDEDDHQKTQDASKAAAAVIPLAMTVEAAAAKEDYENYNDQDE